VRRLASGAPPDAVDPPGWWERPDRLFDHAAAPPGLSQTLVA
jgi:hypothetical protein